MKIMGKLYAVYRIATVIITVASIPLAIPFYVLVLSQVLNLTNKKES